MIVLHRRESVDGLALDNVGSSLLLGGQDGGSDPGHEVAIVELDRNHLGDGSSEGAKRGKIFWINNTLLLLQASTGGVEGDNGSVSEGGHRGWFQSVTLVFLFRHIFTLHFSGLVGTIFVTGHGGWGPWRRYWRGRCQRCQWVICFRVKFCPLLKYLSTIANYA